MWLTHIAELSGCNGYLTGLFFLIFNINAVVGNVIVLVASAIKLTADTLLIIMLAIAAVGGAMLLFTPTTATMKKKEEENLIPSSDPSDNPTPDNDTASATISTRNLITSTPNDTTAIINAEPVKHVDHISLGEWLRTIWHVAGETWTRLLSPYLVQQGVGLAVSFGVLPQLTPGALSDIGLIYLCYGVSGCAASVLCGRIFDSSGWKPLVGLHVLCTVSAYIWAGVVVAAGFNYRCHTITAVILSFVDNASNSICNMTISEVCLITST